MVVIILVSLLDEMKLLDNDENVKTFKVNGVARLLTVAMNLFMSLTIDMQR
jgi:hypothetical protein